jgi:hypothetical protein
MENIIMVYALTLEYMLRPYLSPYYTKIKETE